MGAYTKIQTRQHGPSGKENGQVKSKAVLNSMDGCKSLKGGSNKLKIKKDSEAKLDSLRCTRGITKRTALVNIGNSRIRKNSALNSGGNIIKKKETSTIRTRIEASKALIGLKSKKPRTATATIPAKNVPQKNIEAPKEPILSEKPFALPVGVDNIDAECSEDPQMCAENAQRIICYIKQLEINQQVKPKFLSGSKITGKVRGVLINWLSEVHCQFKLMQETLYLAVGIVDRFLAIEANSIERSRVQLVGVCCMLIACKYEEMYIPTVEDFVYITDGTYTTKQVLEMERYILGALNFNLGRPIAITFLRRNSKAGSVDIRHHWMSKYILEACLVSYELAHIPPSKMAASSLLLSLKLHTPENEMKKLWNANLTYYSGYDLDSLKYTVARVADVVKDAHNSKLNAAYVKYSSESHQSIATSVNENPKSIEILNHLAKGNTY